MGKTCSQLCPPYPFPPVHHFLFPSFSPSVNTCNFLGKALQREGGKKGAVPGMKSQGTIKVKTASDMKQVN